MFNLELPWRAVKGADSTATHVYTPSDPAGLDVTSSTLQWISSVNGVRRLGLRLSPRPGGGGGKWT